MVDLETLRLDDSSELFTRLASSEKERREVLIVCMPHVHFWNDNARYKYAQIIKKTFFQDKAFFTELLSNGDNDSSALLYAHENVIADEQIFFWQ